MAKKDILLDKNGRFLIKNGDLVIEEAEDQIISKIVLASPGSIRQFGVIGAEATKYLKGDGSRRLELERDVRVNLIADDFKLKRVDFSDLNNAQIVTK